jgi:hypothetical protein
MTMYFDCVEAAEEYASELEADCKAIEWALKAKAFDDAYTERVMAAELISKQDSLEELYGLINQLRFPLLCN